MHPERSSPWRSKSTFGKYGRRRLDDEAPTSLRQTASNSPARNPPVCDVSFPFRGWPHSAPLCLCHFVRIHTVVSIVWRVVLILVKAFFKMPTTTKHVKVCNRTLFPVLCHTLIDMQKKKRWTHSCYSILSFLHFPGTGRPFVKSPL